MFSFAGSPTNGRNEVQRVTGGGTISGGTFDLTLVSGTYTLIPWNVTAAQLQAIIADSGIGVTGGPIATTPFTFTFSGPIWGGRDLAEVTASATNLTGAGHSLTPSTVTVGVLGTFRGAPKGKTLQNTTGGALYVNTGTSGTPIWDLAPTTSKWVLSDRGSTVHEFEAL